MIVDYIIVGQGLAGSILSFMLTEMGRKVIVYNKDYITNSSLVAAGLFNPVTGRRFVKTWQADSIFPYLEEFYPRVEKEVNQNFFYSIPVFRPFTDIEDQNLLISKSTKDSLGPYIEKVIHGSETHDGFNNNYGGVFLKHTGYLDIPVLISAIAGYLKQKAVWYDDTFFEENLKFGKDHISYGNHTAKKVIYCTGLGAYNSPYFNWLPFRPVKGEIIYVEMPLEMPYVYNRGVFILPQGNNIFKVGATYNWDHINNDPSENAKIYLEDKLKEVLNVKFKTVDQKAGIRPATNDRRPFIGFHPEINEIAIFNGFGSKGVSLAPYYANQFIDFLEKREDLDKEVNIERYISLYR